MTYEGGIDAPALDQYYNQVHRQADSLARSFIVGFFILGIALSFFHGQYILAGVMGSASLIAYFIIQVFAPGSALQRLVTSFLFWNFGLQFLLEMKGQYEMHFVFFISLTVLLFYEDWKVIVPATVYAVVTLVFLFVWQESAFVKTHFQETKHISGVAFVIHLSAILFYAGLCIRWSLLQHAQTRESAERALTMKSQLQMMDANIAFAGSISQGNLKADYQVADSDRLGKSLTDMRDNLVKSSEREEREKFANLGLARIGEILRQHADNLEALGDRVIEEVVRYMKANQGSIFVLEDQGTDREHLRLVASRAWDRKKFLQKEIGIGEGLVGQAAIEKRTVYMTKVPQEYITITSGLGAATPSCILIVPLKFEDEVVGVIELASFHIYQEFEIKFLERVGETIASTVLTTKNNQRNKELLSRAHSLTEQLRSQEEEIRQNMEEMQATQEEMQRKNLQIERLLDESTVKERDLRAKLEEEEKQNRAYLHNYRQTLLDILDQLPHKIFLKDQDGKMVLVNTVVAKSHNMTIDELIGKSDFDFVDAQTAQAWRDQELEIIRKGSETYLFDETVGDKTITLKTTKMAFPIPHLKQTGLLGIQTDVTELQRLKKESEVQVK
jgi:methyl-accepting chemotaxis protein